MSYLLYLNLGLRWRRVRLSPMLSDFIILMRFFWCVLNEHNTFKKYLFGDETSIRVGLVNLYGWRPKDTYPETISHEKWATKVNIWGAISWVGPTEFAVNQFTFFFGS